VARTPELTDNDATPPTRRADGGGSSSWQKMFQPNYENAIMSSARHRAWSGMSATVKDLRCIGPFRAALQSDCARLGVILDSVGSRSNVRVHPNKATPVEIQSIHHMAYVPSGMPFWDYAERLLYLRHISFCFQENAVAELLDEDLDLQALSVPQLMFYDPALFHISKLFEIECESAVPSDPIYGDCLSIALLRRLANLKRTAHVAQPGRLTDRQMHRVSAYLREQLSEKITLQELASAANLSRSYFSRAFKASTGLTPHQWLLQERVKRAKEYLMAAHYTLADVALATGFGDQAHFTRIFSRLAGTSPANWRRDHRF
jgi:AraC family transcriptional regulator